jgi:hypothetical protein
MDQYSQLFEAWLRRRGLQCRKVVRCWQIENLSQFEGS